MQVRIEKKGLLLEVFEWKNGMTNEARDEEKVRLANALNKIPITFYDNREVINAYNDLYIDITGNNSSTNYNDLFIDLIEAMKNDKFVKLEDAEWTKRTILRTFIIK